MKEVYSKIQISESFVSVRPEYAVLLSLKLLDCSLFILYVFSLPWGRLDLLACSNHSVSYCLLPLPVISVLNTEILDLAKYLAVNGLRKPLCGYICDHISQVET